MKTGNIYELAVNHEGGVSIIMMPRDDAVNYLQTWYLWNKKTEMEKENDPVFIIEGIGNSADRPERTSSIQYEKIRAVHMTEY
ncbi:hypothetical protein LCGC14_0848720 [marine sediment metagenome]|uniref:Uncharacterized protein n=1 Tax=marine sediment metagenome TaxID=412755 RepID=A0A0F9PAX1_9ZZZZ